MKSETWFLYKQPLSKGVTFFSSWSLEICRHFVTVLVYSLIYSWHCSNMVQHGNAGRLKMLHDYTNVTRLIFKAWKSTAKRHGNGFLLIFGQITCDLMRYYQQYSFSWCANPEFFVLELNIHNQGEGHYFWEGRGAKLWGFRGFGGAWSGLRCVRLHIYCKHLKSISGEIKWGEKSQLIHFKRKNF